MCVLLLYQLSAAYAVVLSRSDLQRAGKLPGEILQLRVDLAEAAMGARMRNDPDPHPSTTVRYSLSVLFGM